MATVGETHKIYTDQTGKFPITSSQGNKYILIMYVYDSNAILASPCKSRSISHIMGAYNKPVGHLTNIGYIPRFHCLDNEASDILNKYNKRKYIEYYLVLSNIYCVNAAERSMSTCQDHFIVGISSTDTCFPIHLQCRLIPQATMTLNMLRPCRRNPTMSAHTSIEGQFDFNKTQLAPPGIKLIVHKKPQQHKTWVIPGVPGWYIIPAIEHY